MPLPASLTVKEDIKSENPDQEEEEEEEEIDDDEEQSLKIDER